MIDAFGLFGLERIPISLPRVGGLVLLAAGALLVLDR
ncbi:MAG: DMT family transporter [Gaiellaceae bacterium]